MRAVFVPPTALPTHPNRVVRASPRPRFQMSLGRLGRRALLLQAAVGSAGLLLPHQARTSGPTDRAALAALSEEEWRARLSPPAFAVLRQHATERPFSSALLSEDRAGVFRCAGCGTELFSSAAKFDSGTGWPSFWAALRNGTTLHANALDRALRQREVRCAVCGGHLGHVFRDGPRPTGERYCINGVAMTFNAD